VGPFDFGSTAPAAAQIFNVPALCIGIFLELHHRFIDTLHPFLRFLRETLDPVRGIGEQPLQFAEVHARWRKRQHADPAGI